MPASYHPVQPGIPQSLAREVHYEEKAPTSLDTSLVYRFWSLRTQQPLCRPFEYLVLPDGCIDIIFDLSTPSKEQGALIMTPHTTCVRIPLGFTFRYAGIRLYPGAWHISPVEIVGDMKVKQQLADIQLVDIQKRLAKTSGDTQLWSILEECSKSLHVSGVIEKDAAIISLLAADTTSAAAIAQQTGYSIRHIQRVLRRSVGFSPHDFVKVIRFQRALYTRDTSEYADQSHYIREFKRITGTTPQAFHHTYTFMA